MFLIWEAVSQTREKYSKQVDVNNRKNYVTRLITHLINTLFNCITHNNRKLGKQKL